MYGMSEAGVATCNNPAIPNGCKSGTSGKPLPGYEVAIMGPEGQAMLSCEIGEICIKSKMGFQGYHARPDETAASCRGVDLLFAQGLLSRC